MLWMVSEYSDTQKLIFIEPCCYSPSTYPLISSSQSIPNKILLSCWIRTYQNSRRRNRPIDYLVLPQELPHRLEDPFSEPSIIEMTHVTSILKGNPAHAWDELKKRLLRDVARRVELPVVDQSRGGDLREARYARPAAQRAVQVQNGGAVPEHCN